MIFQAKEVSNHILESVKNEIENLNTTTPPVLAILRVGNDIGSVSYEKSIKNILEPLGIIVKSFVFDTNIQEEDFLIQLKDLNNDETIHSILVFKPLPESFNEDLIDKTINPDKDPDALNPINLGKLLLNDETGFFPCTAEGVVELLDFYNIPIKGKNITIINNSETIGKPLSLLLTNRFGTVSLCHIYTDDLTKFTRDADIVITAVGKYGLIKPDMINKKTTLIDIAVTHMRDKDNNFVLNNNKPIRCGDALETCKDKAQNIISLSPGCGGGTGPITTALLAQHILKAFKQNNNFN